MSLRKLSDDGYEVRWRNTLGRHCGKRFRKGEGQLAKAFDEEVSRGKRLGYLPQLMASSKTIDEVGAEWREARLMTLAPKTQKLYAWLWDALIRPYLAGLRLSELTPGDVETWLARLDTGTTAKRKAAALLHQVFNFAIKKGYVQANPVAVADRPKLPSSGPRRIPSPVEVEQIRLALLTRTEGNLLNDREGDALLVSIMAYGGGMRPQEAWALTWGDVQDELVVHARKTDRTRRARIFAPLRAELAARKLKVGGEQVFPSAPSHDNWRNRVWKDVAPKGMTPYACRHTYVSLCLRDPNISRVEAAQWAGHSLDVQDRTYAHVLASGQADAEQSIRAARAEVFGEVTSETG